MSILSRTYFHDEKAAFRHLEATLWKDGVICPHCGSVDSAGRLRASRTKKAVFATAYGNATRKSAVSSSRLGRHCLRVLAYSAAQVLQAVYLMTASKKGISSHQLHRTLEISYQSAWFLAHRIREAMRDGTLAPMGGAGQPVEVDETFWARSKARPRNQARRVSVSQHHPNPCGAWRFGP